MSLENIIRGGKVCAFLLTVLIPLPVKADPAPPQAVVAGYNENTFSSRFEGDIDLQNENTSGYNWFLKKFFGGAATQPAELRVKKGDGVTLYAANKPSFYVLATAAPLASKNRWVGKAFGGGGYFEAELKFDPMDVLNPANKGWPSFWGMAVEHMASLPEQQWAGQPKGFSHFIEVDFLEYLMAKREGLNTYGGNMHEWSGIWKTTCPREQYCHVQLPYAQAKKSVPEQTDFREYHKFGFLWIPATATQKGSGRYYFDGKPIGSTVEWDPYTGQPPAQGKQGWSFGILDRQHLVLLLGTGARQPMTVKSVNVWQKSDAKNWIGR